MSRLNVRKVATPQLSKQECLNTCRILHENGIRISESIYNANNDTLNNSVLHLFFVKNDPSGKKNIIHGFDIDMIGYYTIVPIQKFINIIISIKNKVNIYGRRVRLKNAKIYNG